MLKTVKIKFQNGLDFLTARTEILTELTTIFNFEESNEPEFIVFGPYGNDIPEKGNYTRIGYFCENIKPDFACCDWAFGIPLEETVHRNNYKRIQWHGFNPKDLIKPLETDAESIFKGKTKFCNFLYSNKLPYREDFFKALNKYKKIDAPGNSMKNMSGIDSLSPGKKWDAKRSFMRDYKFTIAFENDTFPGYQTEKLYDAMLAESLPIYLGDPNISEIFNTKSFIDARQYLPKNNIQLVNYIEKNCQQDFDDIRPQFYHSTFYRVKRHLKNARTQVKNEFTI